MHRRPAVPWMICHRHVSLSRHGQVGAAARMSANRSLPTFMAMSYFSCLSAVRAGDAAAGPVQFDHLQLGTWPSRSRAGLPIPCPCCWHGAW